MKDNNRSPTQCYKPDTRIMQYVKDKIRMCDILKSKDRSRFSTEDKNFDTKLRQDKKRLLDNVIFPSMANLIVFFEYLEKDPELRDLFEDDVKELFGYVRGPHYDKHKGSKVDHDIISRLLGSILKWDINQDPNNFRLDLINKIYKVLDGYLSFLIVTEYRKLPEHILHDIERVDFLIKLYSRSYNKSGNEDVDLYKQCKRPILF